MPNKYHIIIFIMLVFSTIYLHSNCKRDTSYEQEMNRVLSQFHKREGRRLAKKYAMTFCGYGAREDRKLDSSGKMKIILLSLTFQRYILQLEDDARQLIIDCTHDYLNAVNQSEKLRPFLKEFPFSPKNLDIDIFNGSNSRGFVYNPYINVVHLIEGKVTYSMTKDSNILTMGIYKREPYEDALAIIKKQKEEATSNLQNNCE